MPNTQTSVPAFTAGQVLTAQQQTEINTGIPVFATTTTRDAAFGGTGEKTLAEGQFAYIEATNTTQYYDGAAWQTVGGGLTLISATTIGSAVASVTVSSAFSSSYDNYKIIVSGGAGSTGMNIGLTLGASATGYYSAGALWQYNPIAQTNVQDNNATSFARAGTATASGIAADITLLQPFAAARTNYQSWFYSLDTGGYGGFSAGFHNVATSYTAFTLTCSTGTLTGGTIRVYGYQNS